MEMDESHVLASLLPATYATIFFGTPHRGLVVDDIRSMLGENSPRVGLVDSISEKSGDIQTELTKFLNYVTDIKVVTFYEMRETRKLVMVLQRLPPRFLTAVHPGANYFAGQEWKVVEER